MIKNKKLIYNFLSTCDHSLHMCYIYKEFIEEEIDIVVLNMPTLDTRKYKEPEGMGKLVYDIVLTGFDTYSVSNPFFIYSSAKKGVLNFFSSDEKGLQRLLIFFSLQRK